MKKIVLLFAIILFIGTPYGYTQRCLPEQRGIELTGSFGDGYPLLKKRNLDYSLGIGYFRYVRDQNKWNLSIEYGEKTFCYKCSTIPLNQFTVAGGYVKNMLSNKSKSLFFNVEGSLIAGYESVNWGEYNLCDGATLLDKNAFIYGFSVGIELESYVTSRLLVSVRAREKIILGSMKTLHFQTAFSVKYIIN